MALQQSLCGYTIVLDHNSAMSITIFHDQIKHCGLNGTGQDIHVND